MDLTPAELEELLALSALDTLDPRDRDRLEEALGADPALHARADELRSVVALLGEAVAAAPPPDLRSAVLDAAASSPRRGVEGTEPLDLVANRVDELRQLLPDLDDEEWRRRADPYAWSVHGLVAHLLVIEWYTASELGLGADRSFANRSDHLQIGAESIEAELTRSPKETWSAWADVATSTLSALRAGRGPALDATVSFHGYPFTVADLLVVRAFEIWTHTDDIRRACGQAPIAPPPGDLRAMAELSVGSLPTVLGLVDPGLDLPGARVVLTGEGGGTFDLGDPSRRAVLVVADVVDYCRFAARRLTLEQLSPTIEGDRELGAGLLGASRALAV